MELRQLLETVASKYDTALGQQSESAKLLRAAKDEISAYTPLGYEIKGSSGQSSPAAVPWIAVFDPDETRSAMHGMYVVYLFAADMRTIYLTILQGSEDLRHEIKGAARQLLSQQAHAIRQRIGPELRQGTVDRIQLLAPPQIQRPKFYEAGTVLAKPYLSDRLPSDADLRDDLNRFLRLCEHAIKVRRQLALSEPDVIATREQYRPPDEEEEFRPKSGSDYMQTIQSRTLRKSRKHEGLLGAYNAYLVSRGYKTGSPHPRDLTAARDQERWLVEAKVVRRGNAQAAAREALAQLLEYRHFYYERSRPVRMLALFNEPIGLAFVELLESLAIASVWPAGTGWTGSPAAKAAGLCS